MIDKIIIKGASEHNLKSVDLAIPKNQLIVFTGVSGSGKSSLAFDTIYAEGQRRYVESLSSYARQFLGVMGKPDVDYIEGLSPSISIDQKSVSKNPRSTVGTITEIYDYLRLLFARIGRAFCPNDGTEISKLTIDEIVEKTIKLIETKLETSKIKPHVFGIIAPIVTDRKGEFGGLFENLRAKGFGSALVDGKKYELDETISLDKQLKHTIEVEIDSFSMTRGNLKDAIFRSNLKSRMSEAVERAINLSDGRMILRDEHGHNHLFSEKLACPKCDFALPEIEPRLFSFNSPIGACQKCKGLGYTVVIAPELVLKPLLSIDEGGVVPWGKITHFDTWHTRLVRTFLEDVDIDPTIPLNSLDKKKTNMLLYGNSKTYYVRGTNRFGDRTTIREPFIGVVPELLAKMQDSQSEYAMYDVEKFMTEEECSECKGKRLKPEVLHIRIENYNIDDICRLSIDKVFSFIDKLASKLNPFEKEVAMAILVETKSRLKFLDDVGLSYLTLSRSANTLSGGESQRIRLASQIGSGLTGVIYVLDEPSIGLHPKDVAALIISLKHLRDLGNTVIVVEHDPETIVAADYVVDFGPKAGKHGGKVIFSGTLLDFRQNTSSLTAQYLFGKRQFLKYEERKIASFGNISLSKCSQFNLKDISVKFPLGNLICVTGVSGSGKSTLIVETLYKALRYYVDGAYETTVGDFAKLEGYQYIDKVYLVDQSSIGKTPRSNPATYVGVFDHIRDIFAETPSAKLKGFKKGRFSFNVKGGRCEKCGGAGTIKIEMQFLPDVYVTCDVCNGKRYNSTTLEVTFKDKTIYDVLHMTVEEAMEFFKSHPQIYSKLATISEVGLSYIELGQPAPTLSGGEAQRVKLADELSKRDTGRTLYILDEPTTGLHMYDVEKLLATLYKLVSRGNTVIVIEHNLDVIKNCQYIIDLGPEGGDNGGKLLYEGPLAGVVNIKDSSTGDYLKRHGF